MNRLCYSTIRLAERQRLSFSAGLLEAGLGKKPEAEPKQIKVNGEKAASEQYSVFCGWAEA
jgi:hypothetical protein